MSILQMILTVSPLIFLASFVDAVAGGGGLISIPAYLLTGMPVHLAYGSNKFSASIGTGFAVFRFFKNGIVHIRTALLSAGFALIGSALGAKLVLLLSDYTLRVIMTIGLPIMAILILRNKRALQDENHCDTISNTAAIVISACLGFFLGAYDGFFGPGTGTFLILGYTAFMRFDVKTACANAKVVNFASNIAALFVYVSAGKVLYAVAIPATICSILGGWLGSGLAIKKGSKFIRPVLICVLCLLFGKIIYDTFL